VAGEKRFRLKADEFRINLVGMAAGQCLYHGIMGALGYVKNKTAFQELATRLPLELLESVPRDVSIEEYLARQQAWLFGTAGLLPSQRSSWPKPGVDEWTYRLEKLWSQTPGKVPMSGIDWNLFKVRPSNSPVRRMAGMSYLLWRYRDNGLFNGLMNRLKEDHPLGQLEDGLIVKGDGYWTDHCDFGAGMKTNPTLIGSQRAAEIIINVLLPFTFAWSEATGQPDLGERAVCLYRQYPRLTPNAIERHMMAQLGLRGKLVGSVQRQQGLIHLYKTFCTQGRCEDCALGQLHAGHRV